MMDLVIDTTVATNCQTCGVALHETEHEHCASCEWAEDELIIAMAAMHSWDEEDFADIEGVDV